MQLALGIELGKTQSLFNLRLNKFNVDGVTTTLGSEFQDFITPWLKIDLIHSFVYIRPLPWQIDQMITIWDQNPS